MALAARSTMERMKVRVYPLRRRGRRLGDRQSAAGEGYQGELRMDSTMVGSESFTAVHLSSRKTLSCWEDDVLPPLHQPQLVAIGTSSLLLRGYESVEGGGHVQEWHCIFEA